MSILERNETLHNVLPAPPGYWLMRDIVSIAADDTLETVWKEHIIGFAITKTIIGYGELKGQEQIDCLPITHEGLPDKHQIWAIILPDGQIDIPCERVCKNWETFLEHVAEERDRDVKKLAAAKA